MNYRKRLIQNLPAHFIKVTLSIPMGAYYLPSIDKIFVPKYKIATSKWSHIAADPNRFSLLPGDYFTNVIFNQLSGKFHVSKDNNNQEYGEAELITFAFELESDVLKFIKLASDFIA